MRNESRPSNVPSIELGTPSRRSNKSPNEFLAGSYETEHRPPNPSAIRILAFAMLSAIAVLGFRPSAQAQSWTSLPSEEFRWHRSVPAGPYSVVNTATGSLLTSIPLFKLDGPGNTVLDFTITHTSANDIANTNGQVAKRWRQTYDEWAVPTARTLSRFSGTLQAPAWQCGGRQ
jgi:hypothetical protein